MANTLKFKRGLLAGIPTAALGEPLFTTDTFDLYIGNGTGNTKFQKFIASGATTQIIRGDGSLYTFPLAISSPSNGQVLKYNGTSWVNDSDSGITGSGTTNYLPKFTGASTLGNSLVFDNGTNVGIGSIAPPERFSVYGGDALFTQFTGTGNGSYLKILNSTTTTNGTTIQSSYFGSGGFGDLKFEVGGSQRYRVTSGGNFIINNASTDNGLRFQVTGDGYFSGSVGIGTNAPTTKLYVTGSGANSTFDSGIASDARVEFRRAGTRIGFLTWDSGVVELRADSGNYLALGAGGSERARITSGGNFIINNPSSDNGLRFQVTGDGYFSGHLGVGNTAPSTFPAGNNLVVGSGSSNSALTLYSSTSDYGSVNFGDGAGAAQYRGYITYNHSTDAFTFGTSATTRATLDVNGKLGIGITPTEMLEVSSSNVMVKINAATNSYPQLAFYENGSLKWNTYNDFNNDNYVLGNSSGGKLFLTQDGNLGLGVTPSAWSSFKALQLGGSTYNAVAASNDYMLVSANAFFDGGGFKYISNAASSRYLQNGGAHYFEVASSGTAGNAITFTQAMTLTASGNLGVGTATPSYKLDAVSSASDWVARFYNSAASNGQGVFIDLGNTSLYAALGVRIAGTYQMIVGGSGNTLLGSTSDSGEKLQVNGTAKITGNTSIESNLTVDTNTLFVNASTNRVGIGIITPSSLLHAYGTTGVTIETSSGNIKAALDFTSAFYGGTVGGMYAYPGGGSIGNNVFGESANSSIETILFSNSSSKLKIGTVSTDVLSFYTNSLPRINITSGGNVGIGMTPSYKLDVTGSARVSDAIAIGTTPDTNLPFKILKNINSTVGVRFENTSTGASAFAAVQFGQDVSGGTAFANMVYANSAITESGVYKPNGTALINTGSGGLNFLAVSQPIRFFTSTGNGTLRAAITNDGDYTHYNGTNPSASTTDAFRMYSADITAGNAAPHFRTENGGIIKLYQQTTAVTSATYIGGAGTTVTDLDTFDGYTIPQIVKALRNAGLLA